MKRRVKRIRLRPRTKLTAGEKRQLRWQANCDRVRNSVTTRMYPWPRTLYKTPNVRRVKCPGYRDYGPTPWLSAPSTPFLSQLVLLHWHLKYAMRDLRHWKPVTRIMMHHAAGWRDLWANRSGILCVTATASPRPTAALLIGGQSAQSGLGYTVPHVRTQWHLWCSTLVDRNLYRHAPFEKIGPGPWGNLASTGAAYWWAGTNAMDTAPTRPVVLGTDKWTECDELQPDVAAALTQYVREYFMNLTIPGPM